jgi:PEP-CTERM motif-containing protein
MKISIRSMAILVLLVSGNYAHAALIEVFSDGNAVTNLAAADALIAAGGPVATANTNIIEFDDLQDGTRGNFSINNPFPGGITSNFAVQVSGSFSLGAGTTLEVNHDDGMYVLLDGVQVAIADGVVDNRNTAFSVAAGVHVLEIIFFERFGGASLELASIDAAGKRSLFALGDPMSVPEPGTLGLLALGLLGLSFARRKSA